MKKFLTLLAVTGFMLFLLVGYSTTVNSNISENIVRLHILANSDSVEDQKLKLQVRDAILKHSRANFTKKSDVKTKLDEYKEIAETVISEKGYNYPVEVEYGNFKFPTKEYKNIRLPAGNYDALRVKIGNADGQNWWCVMFPPLCFVDGTTDSVYAEEKLQSSLDKESYDIITTSTQNGVFPFEVKFKIVEFYGKLCGRDKVYAKSR
ncbi:MAG: stage II sporulation protein R [Clostridia bacterium]|nr:stage II sporulation protein R [Clostridia bacterium]